MGNDRIYNVHLKHDSTVAVMARVILFFSILIAVIGVSRVWFGGSWVIDLFALIIGICALVAISVNRVGDTVYMTRDDLSRWVRAGCPDDWKTGE